MEKPKYKREIREAIIINVNKNKNAVSLRNLLTVSDIMCRAYDNKSYETLTKKEWNTLSVINNILTCDEKQITNLKAIVNGYMYG